MGRRQQPLTQFSREKGFWSLDRVNKRLGKMMTEAFDAVYAISGQYKVSLRIAAYIVAIDKVARTLKLRGIYA